MLFIPERIFQTIDEITPEILNGEGIKGLVLDIDHTLAPRNEPLPDKSVIGFVQTLKKAGIKLFILSNNRKNRVSKFAKALEVEYISFGLKPFPWAFHRALHEMGIESGSAAALGDQIFTDVLGAHTSGMRAWLVSPVGPGSSAFYRIRRRLEQHFINEYYRRAGK